MYYLDVMMPTNSEQTTGVRSCLNAPASASITVLFLGDPMSNFSKCKKGTKFCPWNSVKTLPNIMYSDFV